ncbi:glycoside hydrolase family 15 protein [Halomarina litorea]|uniref:glycoside hydrolase family 15 protein n=1 Tax=Halomarina litorea TaxID=2961595 RepID=UPI0020C5328F|nr:glycoside hydrolase family 15 protein [Halomarina sp. BCD28]
MEYRPLESYGVVGNRETCALVGPDGSVDWFCLPHLASGSVFARLLDPETGGGFDVRPIGDFEARHDYLPDTAVLRTTFETPDGEATLTDFMPAHDAEGGDAEPLDGPDGAFFRRATCESGEVTLDVGFHPRFDYARSETTVTDCEGGYRATGEGETLTLLTDADLTTDGADATGSVRLSAGESCWFVLVPGDAPESVSGAVGERALARTVAEWREWARSGRVDGLGDHRDVVVRSALTLRLLADRTTGAIAAAPTTSLPEDVGGVRNWDYRFHWLRDASICSRALARLGYTEVAHANVQWWLDHLREHGPEREDMLFRPLYDLGEADGTEEVELDHLAGYRDSRPVRIGNGARDQRQLDIYGELLLTVDELVDRGVALTPEEWSAVHEVVEHVCAMWTEPDYGIWEVRSTPEHFVHSQVMCWATVDRGIAVAEAVGVTPPDHWHETRAAIKERVLSEGFNEELNSFVRSFEATDALDAACLRIPQVGFLPADDERVQGTIDAVLDRLVVGEGLVQRYEGPDGLSGEDHAFVLCTFWLVDALARAGRVAAARETLSAILDRSSSLDLFAEEIDPLSGEHRGNFPLGFAHAGLVSSVLRLTDADRTLADAEAHRSDAATDD